MAATNATTAKKTTTTTAATSRTTATTAAATNVAATPSKSSSPTQPSASNGLLPTFDLASFLGLPSVIDYQDIAIRVAMVVTGIVLLILVAWSFVRGKQTTNVQVVAPSATTSKAAEEAAEGVAV